MHGFKNLFIDRKVAWMIVVAALAVALTGDYAAQTIALGACFALALMGVDLVIGYAGMITIGHAALFGVGAYAAASLSWKWGVPMPFGLLAGAIFGAVAGWILSWPVLKASDKYVALATLVMGLAFAVIFIEAEPITNGSVGITLDKREFFDHILVTRDFALIGLASVAIGMVILNRMADSAMGRAFEAIRDSDVAANCLGVSAAHYKQIAFTLSGVFCGFAGALFSYSQGYISPNTFGFDTSVTFLLASMLGGKKTRSGALLGAAVVIFLPVALNSVTMYKWMSGGTLLLIGFFALQKAGKKDYSLVPPTLVTAALFGSSFYVVNMVDARDIIYGLLILGVTYYLPNGLAGSLPKQHHVIKAGHGAKPLTQCSVTPNSTPSLELNHISMSFDGFKALEDVSVQFMPGKVCGIIGPNGSGKSTLINVITGVYIPTSGSINVKGSSTAALGSARIAQLGIARTFQNLQTFTGLSAIENVLVGLTRKHESNLINIALGIGRTKDLEARKRAQALLDFVGLGERANTLSGGLSYGEQRYLEIARALATDPEILLLDEPAAGLRGADLQRLKEIICAIRAAGLAVIVIEHHMDVISEVCDTAMALNFGKSIAEGTPTDVLSHPSVRLAYLGA